MLENKREKKFCNSTCRSSYWQKEKVKMKATKKPVKESIVEKNAIKEMNNDLIERLSLTMFEPIHNLVATEPKTLEELKSACPKNLTGFEKSAWISENRLKFNI